jgi:hypothetical protein
MPPSPWASSRLPSLMVSGPIDIICCGTSHILAVSICLMSVRDFHHCPRLLLFYLRINHGVSFL